MATITVETTKQDGSVETDTVTVEPGHYNYKGVVDAIITHRYPDPEMDAINNNYLDDPTNEQYVSEREEMKAWRRSAKEIALELFPDK